MIQIKATVTWERSEAVFSDNRYSRAHLWSFDGGAQIPASSSPHIVPLPYSLAENVDPEEAFVASLSSCHMLTFLSLAAKRGYVVDRYSDHATGTMAKNAQGHLFVDRVVLRPRVSYAQTAPNRQAQEQLHHEAHEQCFIANSVVTKVVTEL